MATHTRRSAATAMVWFVMSTIALAVPFAGAPVFAQDGVTPSASGSTSAAPSASASGSADGDAQKLADAKEHFGRGFQLMQEESWDAALAEFLASIALVPRVNSMKNAAICLKQLKRYDESLVMFRRISMGVAGPLSPSDLEFVNRATAELEALTGYVAIAASVSGATVVIDGRERGKTPLAGPVLVNAGTRSVRVVKEGYEPFEAKPIVAAKATMVVEANLVPLARSGRITVVEASGKVMEVVIDGVSVGKTPYAGALPPGVHSVLLRQDGAATGPRLGTQPTATEVIADQSITLNLTAEPLNADVRVEVEPAGATLLLDGALVGKGGWEGAIRVGSHRLDLSAEGYFAQSKTFDAADGQRVVSRIVLERDDNSPFWAKGRTYPLSLSVVGGGLVGLSLGGEYESSCSTGGTDCYSHRPTLGFLGGARIGYDLAPALTLELSVGFALLNAKVSRRTQLVGDNGPVPVDITDKVTMSGPFFGVGASYAFFRRPFILSGAISGGIVLARVKATRTGTTTVDTEPTTRELATRADDAVTKAVPFILPEVRFGFPLTDRFVLGFAIGALIGISDVRPTVRQAPVSSDNDFVLKPDPDPAKPAVKVPIAPQHGGKTIGFVPHDSNASATGTFILPEVSVFARMAF